jgi:hypothetical protein
MERHQHLPQFLNTRKLALWLTILLGAILVLDMLNIASNVAQLSHASKYPETAAAALSDDDIDFTSMPGGMAQAALTLLSVGIALLSVLGFIATAVIFLIWMRRSSINLKALDARGMEYSPGWAVGAWFVPFMNLVRPYSIIKEIWYGSNPDDDRLHEFPLTAQMRQAAQSNPMLGIWWAFWIISNIVSNAAWRLSLRATLPEENLRLLWVDIAASVFWIIAAFMAINVVRAITSRQEQRHERLSASIPTLVPPPLAAL